MEEHLDNAPLVEALLELRWKLHQETSNSPPVDLAYPIVVGLLYERVKETYPFVESLPQSRFPPEVLPFSATHRFRVSQGQWPLVQIGPGVGTLNYTTSYRWPRFEHSAQELGEHLRDAYKVAAGTFPGLEQVTLRYINAIEFSFGQESIHDFLRDKLHIKCKLPDAIASPPVSGNAVSFHLQVGYPVDRPAGQALLNLGRGQKNDSPALVWDLLFISVGNDVPGFDELAQWLSDAHDILEKWFFTLIEGDLYHEFKGDA